MTYLEAARDIIEMYNIYAIKCDGSGRSCGDHSESVAMAVEALSIVAGLNRDSETCAVTETTGHIRKIDDLGRILIPKSIREVAFGTTDTAGRPMEIYYKKDRTIILKPCESMEEV